MLWILGSAAAKAVCQPQHRQIPKQLKISSDVIAASITRNRNIPRIQLKSNWESYLQVSAALVNFINCEIFYHLYGFSKNDLLKIVLVFNKASLSFGRTSTGIEFLFLGGCLILSSHLLFVH